MLAQSLLTFTVLFSIDITGVGRQRGLGINDQVLVTGQIDDRVRTLASIFTVEAHLTPVIDAGPEARVIQYVFQHQLAPVALNLFLSLLSSGEFFSLFGNRTI